jgi:ADP-heptose:LPS heptosyltransferase
MPVLQIYDRRERAAVAAADAAFRVAAAVAGPFRRRRRPSTPRRILLLRLERIGDLVMVLAAIADVRATAPAAEITLVVGDWNEAIARSIPGISQVETVSAAWLARGSGGLSLPVLIDRARRWRTRQFDVGINFEPDIRSNLMLAASGARWTAGYRSGGGGPLLDQALDYLPSEHTTDNARRLVAAVMPGSGRSDGTALLVVPDEHQRRAATLLGDRAAPMVAMHVPGGRLVKQWAPRRFADVALDLIERRGAHVVLTGSRTDDEVIGPVKQALPADRVIDLSSGHDLLTVAAVLARCDLMITGDTGPMHLAAAVGTPIVAVFGPSDPARYAPRGPLDQVVRVDLPCAPCNRIRLPPARCTGCIPDCLASIPPERVLAAALGVLDASRERRPLQEQRG